MTIYCNFMFAVCDIFHMTTYSYLKFEAKYSFEKKSCLNIVLTMMVVLYTVSVSYKTNIS